MEAKQLSAGCAAGLLADLIVHPVSTVKARLQVQGSGGGSFVQSRYRGILHGTWSILRNEGVATFYRGMGAVFVGAAPAQGVYFLAYESAKRQFEGTAWGSFGAGICAQLFGSLIWVPLDIVKERLQVKGHVPSDEALFSGSRRVLSQILREEGMRGLYRGFLVNQATWAPFNGIYFGLYEKCKDLCINAGYEDGHDNLEPTAQVCCAATAGIFASLITNPVDVLKTRVQVAKLNPEMFPFSSGLGAAKHLLQHEGPLALMDGAGARALWLTPRLTVVVSLYESILGALK